MNTSPLRWRTLPFTGLSAQELHDILRLRVDVFVVEQRCAYAEVDGLDPQAHHVLGQDGQGAVVAYARILPPGRDGLPHIGRVVVHPQHRGLRLGVAVMEEALRAVERIHGTTCSAVAAQAHLQRFYEGLGYVRENGPYDWDGIPHVDMVRGRATGTG